MERAAVLVIDQAESNIKDRLGKRPEYTVVGCTNSLDIGFTLAERHQPSVILLNFDMLAGNGVSAAEVFALEFPNSSLILMTSSDSRQVLRQALRIGAKEVLNLPVENDRLFMTINRIFQRNKNHRTQSRAKKKQPQFKTITFFSTKGGVGKTTLALNTAIAMRQITNKRVVLVDLNLHSGNAALLAGVPWRRSVKDLVDEINNLDEEILEGYCTTHPSGLKILPAPINSEYAAFIQPEHVEKILQLMSRVFNYVIVDAPNSFHDTIIPALEQSGEIMLVTTLDLAAIQCLKQASLLLKGLSLRSKVRLVINRMGYSGGLKLKDLEDELGFAVHCTIPDCEKTAIDAVNLGNPIYLLAPKSAAALKLHELAVKMIADDGQASAGVVKQNIG